VGLAEDAHKVDAVETCIDFAKAWTTVGYLFIVYCFRHLLSSLDLFKRSWRPLGVYASAKPRFCLCPARSRYSSPPLARDIYAAFPHLSPQPVVTRRFRRRPRSRP